MVLLGILEFEQGKTAAEIVNAPRFHHQYLPDTIQLEPNLLSEKVQQQLSEMGHQLDQKTDSWGNMQLVIYNKKTATASAASDGRVIGQSQVINLPLTNLQLD
jgi:gamma-glutamyltranspeptidase/glutathione hydrolase